MTICNNCKNPCCDCNCPGCNCKTTTFNGIQCCTMCITGLQRIMSVSMPAINNIPQSVYMKKIIRQRLEAEQHNRFNQ